MNRTIRLLRVLFLGFACVAHGATRTWISSVGGLWTSTANWSDNTLPVANDIADLSAATGTIDLTANVTVGEILYNPTFNGTTNTLTILSDTPASSSRMITLTTTARRHIQVGAGAELELDVDFKPTGVLLKDGYGTVTLKRRLPGTVATPLWIEQGRFVNEGDISIFQGRISLGSVEPEDGAAPEFVMREGSTYATYRDDKGSDMCWGGNHLSAAGTGSRGVVMHEGGLIDLTTNVTGGVFLNGYAADGYAVYNLSGGEVNLANKTVYVSFNGMGTINQSGGKFKASAMNFSRAGSGTYNLTGGELWLGGNATKGSGKAAFNIGGACIYPLNAGYSISATTSPQFSGIGGLTRFCSEGSGFSSTINGFTGSGGFLKEGADTLNIAGTTHSFTGPVIVSNGTVNVNTRMSGGNPVLVVGGTMNLGNVSVQYSSLMVTGGVLQLSANSALTILDPEPTVRVMGDGVIKMLDGSALSDITALDVSENGAIDLSDNGTASVYSLVLDGIEQAPGLYTSATCPAISGTGTLAVNSGYWSGAGADGLWSTDINWLSGIIPDGARATVDLSGALSNEMPVATLVMDIAAVTENYLMLASGVAGAVLTNTCPTGVTNTLNVMPEGVIYVEEGETLVLDHNLCMQGNINKRGEGTLVLLRKTYATTAGAYYLRVEAGKVINCGSMTNTFVMVGKPLRTAAGGTPEFILADTPEATFGGLSFITCMSTLPTSLNPGSGVFTQNGGVVTPDVGWASRTVLAFVNVAGVSSGGTGTYNLVNGTLRVQGNFELSRSTGYGILNQSGGLADLDKLLLRKGEVVLTGGLLQVNEFVNSESDLCTFYMGGGCLESKTTTALTLASPVVFTGVNGDMAFDLAAGQALTLSGAASGSSGFVKEGSGALTFSGSGNFLGLAEISGGIVNLSGSWQGTNDVLLMDGVLNMASGSGVKLGTLAVTNGIIDLATGLMAMAERFVVEGVELPPGVYTSTDTPVLTGDGKLIVGLEIGQWLGGVDENWSSAGNWAAEIIPAAFNFPADLSAAVTIGQAVATLYLDLPVVTNQQVTFRSGIHDAVLTNTCPMGVTNTLYLAANGVIDVGAGETLVLDHDLCGMGDLFKRGLGTLVLRRKTFALPSIVTANAGARLFVESGRVIQEGPMTNVLVSVGKLERDDPQPTPEFILANTEHASIRGISFIDSLNSLAKNPGAGLFTQNGGVVNPGIGWENRMILAHTISLINTHGTGTYHLINGQLIVEDQLGFSKGGAYNGNYGIFKQSGGVADIQRLAGSRGEMRLTGGLTKFGVLSGVWPDVTFYLGGGRLQPKSATPVVFSSPMVFTGVNGDMIFESAAGQTIQLSVDAVSSGAGGFVKVGDGSLQLANTNTFIGTAAIQAGTCSIAGAGGLAQCTNLVIGAGAHLTLQRDGAALNTNLWLKVNADGQVNLDYAGEVEVGHLVINGREWPGRGSRYGASSSAGEVDKVFDTTFTGTGVLKVVGPRGPQGTLLQLR